MNPPMRVLSLPSLNQDLDLDCIDAELIWLGIPKNRKTGQRTSCKVCGLKFSTPIVLQQHLSTVHSKDNRRNHRNIDHWLQSCNIPLTYEEVVNLPFEEFEEFDAGIMGKDIEGINHSWMMNLAAKQRVHLKIHEYSVGHILINNGKLGNPNQKIFAWFNGQLLDAWEA